MWLPAAWSTYWQHMVSLTSGPGLPCSPRGPGGPFIAICWQRKVEHLHWLQGFDTKSQHFLTLTTLKWCCAAVCTWVCCRMAWACASWAETTVPVLGSPPAWNCMSTLRGFNQTQSSTQWPECNTALRLQQAQAGGGGLDTHTCTTTCRGDGTRKAGVGS